MAVALGVDTTSGTANSKTTGATLVVNHGQVRPGETLVCAIGVDNLTATTPTVSSITKPGGETAVWVKIGSVDASVATAAGACRGELWAITSTVTWAAGSQTITFSSASTLVKVACTRIYYGVTTTARGTVPSGTTNGAGVSTSGVPAATTAGAAPATGDLVLGLGVNENNSTPGTDPDTLNGPWVSAAVAWSTGGNALTNVGVILMHKIVTAGGAQTLNPTSNGDSGAAVVALVPKTLAAPAKVTGVVATGQSAQVSVAYNYIADAASYTIYRDGVSLATGQTVSPYVDTTVVGSTSYSYTVAGVNSAGTGTQSDPSSAAALALYKTETVSSDFATGTTWWTNQQVTFDGNCNITVSYNGGPSAVVRTPTGPGGAAGAMTIKDSYVQIENVSWPPGAPTDANRRVQQLSVVMGSTTRYTAGIAYEWGGGSPAAGLRFTFAYQIADSINPIPFDPVAHRWWRIREGTGAGAGGTSGNLYWDTSPDGVTWTNRRTYAHGLGGGALATDGSWLNTPTLTASEVSGGAAPGTQWWRINSYNMAPTAPVGGKVKVWSGSAQVPKPVKWWNGSAWVEKPMKHWTGSQWKLTNSS